MAFPGIGYNTYDGQGSNMNSYNSCTNDYNSGYDSSADQQRAFGSNYNSYGHNGNSNGNYNANSNNSYNNNSHNAYGSYGSSSYGSYGPYGSYGGPSTQSGNNYSNNGYSNGNSYGSGYGNSGYNNNNSGYNNHNGHGYNNGSGYNNGWNSGNQSFNYNYGSYNTGGGYNPNGGYDSYDHWYGYQPNGYDDPAYGGSHSTQNMSFMPPPRQSQSWGKGSNSYQYSQCTGNRKALLIGINYIGQKAELKGCINDVQNIKRYLMEKQGYRQEDMVILTDDNRDSLSVPTRANILKACQWLVRNAQPNDSLFFHFSGHGGRTEDLDGDETDGYDDVIYPVDYTKAGFIVDDDLHNILVKPLLPGVRLTALLDCCHSGTGLDLPYVYSTKGLLKEPNLLKDSGKTALTALMNYKKGNISEMMNSFSSGFDKLMRGSNSKNSEAVKQQKTSPADVVMFSGCKDTQTSADTVENGAATGAMSHAFIQVMRNNPNQSYLSLLNNMRDILASKYQQKPQLSCSHPLDCNLKFIM